MSDALLETWAINGRVVLYVLDAAAAKPALRQALARSAAAIGQMLTQALPGGKVKGFKPHAAAFAGYLIAHEGYHLGEIGVALQQSGHPLDRKTAFGMREWGVRQRQRLLASKGD